MRIVASDLHGVAISAAGLAAAAASPAVSRTATSHRQQRLQELPD
jgi:hypothetical protein